MGVSQPSTDQDRTATQYDVVIAGAGLGGLAAAIWLRAAGARVICIEPDPFPHARVGESLDWSAPALLKGLGLDPDQLVAENCAIYKKKIRLFPLGRPEFDGGPHAWFKKRPLGFEVTTLHVDRVSVDSRLFDRACSVGVEFVWDRVTDVEKIGERVRALRTQKSGSFQGTWFIDASGQAQLFAKAFHAPHVDYGRRKVCLWTYFDVPTHYEGTSFYGDDMAEYLSWSWEIPINASTISVGCIMPADQVQAKRKEGQEPREILTGELARFPRFAPLLAAQPTPPIRATSYRCYVNEKVCGPNWVMVGEAAALPDPLTGNGFTAALRHARDATAFMIPSLARGSFTDQQMRVYDNNVRRMGHGFNSCIELCAYQPWMRWGLGSLVAMTVYTGFAYLINALYTKFNPQTPRESARFGMLFSINQFWMGFWSLLARVLLRLHRPAFVMTDTEADTA